MSPLVYQAAGLVLLGAGVIGLAWWLSNMEREDLGQVSEGWRADHQEPPPAEERR